ncbi:MAG: hypothetical protein AAF242_16260, partial [Bacteroidota bacterium]
MSTNNSSTIVKVVRGSYSPQVQLDNGRQVDLTDLMIGMYNDQLGGAAGVKSSIVLSNDRSITNAADTFKYSPSSKPTSLIRIPTLEELGFAASGHQLEVTATAYLRSGANQEIPTEVKLVDKDGQDIAGTLVLNNQVRPEHDYPVQMTRVTIAGGTQVAADFRKVNAVTDT